jgi:SET domain-containing protein
MQHSQLIYVKQVEGKGRGVFARDAIAKGALIEQVPLLLVPLRMVTGGLENPDLSRFFFMQDDPDTLAVCLGYGSLYNHSYTPNARYDDGRGATMLFTALCDIARDEEICINYNGEPGDTRPMTFRVV